MSSPPAEHVLAAFGVPGTVPELLDGGQGSTWRCADTVLSPAASAAEAAWIAGTFEHLTVPGLRLARPVRSSDGRWVVGGWTAHRFLAGEPTDRYEDILAAGDRLHEALAGLPRPRFLQQRSDLYSRMDRLAWGEAELADENLGEGVGVTVLAELAAGRRPVNARAQIVHGDLFGNVLFQGSEPPAVIDVTPYWRPPSWAAAVVVVDAITWGGATTELVDNCSDREDWPEMIRRALMFRLAVSLAHPRSTAASMVEMLSAAEVLRPFIEA